MSENVPNNVSNSNRICPGCGIEFSTRHKSRKFCTEICYNNYYNSNIRNNQDHRLQQQEFGVVAIRTLIGESSTATVPIEALDSIGFRFDLYSNRVKSSPISETYYVWYGPYRLNLTPENQILITLKR